MREWVDPDTGEVFALVPMAWWQAAVDAARDIPDPPVWRGAGVCECAFCEVVAAVMAAAAGEPMEPLRVK